MGFELRVMRNNPLTGESDLDQALKTLLKSIGYLPEGYQDDIGFRLMRSCFLKYPDKPWTIDELLTELNSSRSTLYRYLNKLKGLDILDEIVIPMDNVDDIHSKKTRKGYRIRFKSLSLAWSLVESHTQVAMQNYRKSVEHIDRLAKSQYDDRTSQKRKKPSITVDGIIFKEKNKGSREILLIKRGGTRTVECGLCLVDSSNTEKPGKRRSCERSKRRPVLTARYRICLQLRHDLIGIQGDIPCQ